MDDMISRKVAIDALNRHLDTIPVVNNNTMEMIRRSEVMDCREIINGLPSAEVRTEMSSANDTISRQAAKSKKVYSEERHEYVIPVAEIDWLPSAQPEQRYTEEELLEFRHGISLSLLSKRSAQHWHYDEDTATEIKFLERLYEKVCADMRGEQDE